MFYNVLYIYIYIHIMGEEERNGSFLWPLGEGFGYYSNQHRTLHCKNIFIDLIYGLLEVLYVFTMSFTLIFVSFLSFLCCLWVTDFVIFREKNIGFYAICQSRTLNADQEHEEIDLLDSCSLD